MDKPIWIFMNALEDHGLNRNAAKAILRPMTEEEDMLNLAEWVALHPEATIQEIRKEMHGFLR